MTKRITVRRNGVLRTIPAPKAPFIRGEIVEFQREPTHVPTWERGTYLEKVDGMKGWHRVQLPVVGRIIVPTRRLRHTGHS